MIKKILLFTASFLLLNHVWSQVPSYVPQYGLLGYYPFNGNSNDVSSNAAHLSNNGAVLTTDRFGTAASAYSFNGVSQNLINNTPNFTFSSTSSFTYSFWYNRNVTSTTGVIIMNATNAAGNFIWLFQAGPTNMQYGTNKQQSAWIWVPTTTTTNTWTHIVCVYNAGVMTLYKDNVLIGTGVFTYTTGVTSANMPLYVGRGVGGNYFNGKIDDVGIWNRALTTCEINDLFTTTNSLTGVSAGPDLFNCNSQAITLNGSGALNYYWNQNVSNGVAFVPTATANYTLTGFNANGCSAWDETTVTLGQLSINAGQDVSVCPGDTVVLSATGAQSYTWNNSVINNQPFVATQSGTYIATGVDGSCTDTDTLLINVLPLPQINAGNDTVLCAGGLVTLTARGGQNYSWNNGIQNAVAFTALSTQTCVVTGYNASGCANQDTLEVIANAVPNIDAGADIALCTGQSVVLNAVGGINLQWNNGVQDGVPFVPSSSGTYSVTGMSNDGCYGSDSLILTVNNTPDISAGLDVVICQGDSVILQANGGSTYQWSNGANNGEIISPTQTITLGVTGYNGVGCSNTDSMTITVNNPSQNTITANALDTYTLNGISYQTSGTYTQILPNAQGCDSTITLILTLEHTGFEEFESTSLSLHPNPAHESILVSIPASFIGAKAQVFDAFGKEISGFDLNALSQSFDCSQLARGTYFIRVTDYTHAPIRFVKE